jgi:hypothetical protein
MWGHLVPTENRYEEAEWDSPYQAGPTIKELTSGATLSQQRSDVGNK